MDIWKALVYLYPHADPQRDYELLDRGNGPYVARWNLPAPPPTAAQIEQAIAAYDAREARRQQDAHRLKQTVRTTAQSTIGKRFGDLSATERNALLLAVLYRLDVIDADTRIRPLEEWL